MKLVKFDDRKFTVELGSDEVTIINNALYQAKERDPVRYKSAQNPFNRLQNFFRMLSGILSAGFIPDDDLAKMCENIFEVNPIPDYEGDEDK